MNTSTYNKKYYYVILIFIIFCNCNQVKSVSDNQQFLDTNFAHLPKCCALHSALEVTSETTFCSQDNLQLTHFEISARHIISNESDFANNCKNVDCVDFINHSGNWSLVRMQNCTIAETYKNYIYFPKCCPNDYVYDRLNHTCVKISDKVYTFEDNLQVFNISLAHCSKLAIVDFDEKFIINESDRSVTFGEHSINYKSYCIDKSASDDKRVLRACLPNEVVCNTMKKRCLKKCCPDGETYAKRNGRGSCLPFYTAPFNVSKNTRFRPSDTDYGIIFASPGNKYMARNEHEFFIDEVGYFHTLKNGDWIILNPTNAYYCTDHFLSPKHELEPLIFLLFSENNIKMYQHLKYFIQGGILGVSSIFMFITMLCYIFVPVLQNVHGRCILMYCIFMWLGCAALCSVQMGRHDNYKICVSLGFFITFTFLGAFAWMNVVCFDMWIAFGTVKTANMQRNKTDLKKFIYYNIYAWGVPIIVCGFALLAFFTEFLPDPFIPHIGILSCYFEKRDGTYDYILFFLFPIAVMLLVNVVLFIKTSLYCYNVKNEIQRMQMAPENNNAKRAKRKRFLDDKETFGMLLKIFIVMGMPWTFEFVSSVISFHDTSVTLIIEAIGDYINSTQGIIIFCILILKKRVYLSIKGRLGIGPMPSFTQNSTSTTNTSRNRSAKAMRQISVN